MYVHDTYIYDFWNKLKKKLLDSRLLKKELLESFA